MKTAKVAITLDQSLLEQVDRLVEQQIFPIAAEQSRRRFKKSSIVLIETGLLENTLNLTPMLGKHWLKRIWSLH